MNGLLISFVEPLRGSPVFVYYFPWVSPTAIHIEPLRGSEIVELEIFVFGEA